MDRETIEMEAARTVQDKGLGYLRLPAPLLFRPVVGKWWRIAVPMPTINTYAACLELYLQMGLNPQQALQMDFNDLLQAFVTKRSKAVALVATAVCGKRWPGAVWRWWLRRYIGRHCPARLLVQAAQLVVVNGGIEDFCNFIGLAQRMNILSQTSQTNFPTS